MFDFFDTSKLLIIGAVALMVIPPKDLPTVLRQLGQAVGKLRRMATEFQTQFNDALKDAEFDNLKKELQELQSSTNMPLDIGTDFNIATPAPVLKRFRHRSRRLWLRPLLCRKPRRLKRPLSPSPNAARPRPHPQMQSLLRARPMWSSPRPNVCVNRL